MRFGSIRPQSCRGLHRSFGQRQPGGSVLRPPYSINGFVRIGEQAVSVEERGITLDRFIQKFNGLPQVWVTRRAEVCREEK